MPRAALHRPAEVDLLKSDPTKARRLLGWEPQVSFERLVRMMVDADVALLAPDGRPARPMAA
jgi:GDPmannose 4,6-dehydratase